MSAAPESRAGPSPGAAPEAGGEGTAPAGRPSVGAWLHGAAVLGLLAAFLVSIRPVLSPLALFVLLLYVLWPTLASGPYRRLAVAASVLFFVWLLDTTGLLLAPFILAFILAYIFDPVVDRIEARGLPRSASIGLLTLPVLGLLAVLVFIVVPAVVRQLSEFISNIPTLLEGVDAWLEGVRAWLIGLGIPGIDQQTVPRLREIDAEAVVEWLQGRRIALAEGGIQAVLGIGRGLGAVLTLLAYLVLLPILAYYLLRDWDRIRCRVLDLVPRAHEERVSELGSRFDDLLSRYLRGQLLLAVLVGFVIWLGFTIVGFPYALLLGLVAAVFNIVPYLGLAVSLGASLLVALFSGAILASLLKVAVVFAVEQVVEGVLGPLIVGESVGLHPVWVLLALALFSFFFGFVGLLLAVPAAVFLKLMIELALRRYRGSAFYGPAAEREAASEA